MSDDGPKLNLEWLKAREQGAVAIPPSAAPAEGEVHAPTSPSTKLMGEDVEAPQFNNLEEVLQLGAVDSIFFNQIWFPKTFRQAPAIFHPHIYKLIDNPLHRYINIQVMRDGAKTTILRAYSAKRIAYGLSRTILYVAQSETKAKQSVGWLKNQITTNTRFSTAFGLVPSKPWSDEHISILHGVDQHQVHVLAFGVTGGLRGINLDDWRPDLIIVDDALTDENASNEEQREKLINLIFGAVKESLARRSEVPDAKLVLLNTPQDFADISEIAKKDAQFVSASYGCWTEETRELDIDEQESSWPAAYPSAELRVEKRAALARNRYSIFAREKECKLLIPEDCTFRSEWLRFFGEPGDELAEPPLDETWVEMAIDPVPPPSDRELEKGLKGKDYESFAVGGRYQGRYYLLDQVHSRGHNPGWTIKTFFEMIARWRVRKVLVEAVAYQRVLAWILQEAMRTTGRYVVVEPFVDKRRKHNRIVDGLHGISANGALAVRRQHSSFISQFTYYGGKSPDERHDDDLESAAVVMQSLTRGFVGDVAEDWYKSKEELVPSLPDFRGCP